MGADLKQAIRGFAAAWRNRELSRSERIVIAVIADVSPFHDNGFVVCRLIDGTNVNVHAWTNLQLTVGQTAAIMRISDAKWSTYFLLSVNGTTDAELTPFSVPTSNPTSLPVHAIDGDRHSGNLPWNRVDTAGTQVNLASQVTGVLPLANQQLQLAESTLVVLNASVAAAATASGNVAAPKRAIVAGVAVTGGGAFTLKLFKDSGHTTSEYETFADTACPFADPGLWYHAADASKVYYELTNDGGTATFSVTLTLLAVEA